MVEKYYVVFEGCKLGIYNTSNKAKLQVLGFCDAQHKMYKDQRDAKDAFIEYWTINDTEPLVEITQENSNNIFPKIDKYTTHSYYYKI